MIRLSFTRTITLCFNHFRKAHLEFAGEILQGIYLKESLFDLTLEAIAFPTH